MSTALWTLTWMTMPGWRRMMSLPLLHLLLLLLQTGKEGWGAWLQRVESSVPGPWREKGVGQPSTKDLGVWREQLTKMMLTM
jgi:hypothetical protein